MSFYLRKEMPVKDLHLNQKALLLKDHLRQIGILEGLEESRITYLVLREAKDSKIIALVQEVVLVL
jgi:hypothetical protein